MDGQTNTPITPEVTPAPETASEMPTLTATGKPEDAGLMQTAVDAAKATMENGVKPTENPMVAGTEVTVPEFSQPAGDEEPVAAPAPTIEIAPPPASVGPAPELPQFPQAGQLTSVAPGNIETVPIRQNPFEEAPAAPTPSDSETAQQ